MSTIWIPIAAVLVLGGLAAYQLYVNVLVWRAAYSSGQKWAQTVGIWVVPLLGAIACHAMLRTEQRAPSDQRFVPERNIESTDGNSN